MSNWLGVYEPLLKKKNLDLVIQMSQTPIYIYCDLEKIQVIVNNLISNAINYSPENSTINIELSQDEEAVFLKVIDHGSGINTQDLEHIFEWYYQANTTLKKDGSGIGLALSRRFALLHNGTLAVASKLGSGSTFTLKLPKDDSLVDAYLEEGKHASENKKFIEASIQSATENGIETQATQAMRIKPESQRALILLIDDNPDILDFLDTSLSQNYDLIQAENGEEGIAQACKHVPDLIISDVMMPIKNGIDLCNYIKNRKETSHIPIILLSAKSNTEMIATGYTEGADDYILKPFNLQLLKARIENLIDSRKRLLKAYSENENTLETVDDDQKRLLDVEKKFLVEFHQIVEGQMQQGIKTVEVVAQEIGMSRSSLYRKIKAITGKNINEYIRNIKLDKAAQLIEKEQFTISQAAYEVGFGDAKYFRKIFKERFGKTPSAFKPN